ncbi:MAG TPA: glycine cleavage T C-terminal barrel domain-containing protein, partial [Gaiellales bacterium]|nr:glycine cleavage T C-terminal barrel domain-containing protein [Gaiellales bacterium]
VRGSGAFAFLQTALSNDLRRIGPGGAQYTLLLDEQGAPVDDLIAYRWSDEHLTLVVNASRAGADREWLEQCLPGGVELHDRTVETAMIALQGPAAPGLVGLPALPPFRFAEVSVRGVSAVMAATGYTGEAGVELIVDAAAAGELWDLLVAAGAQPAGLGARDTLRLEVCYPLYGNDLDRRWTALQSGLGWVCALDSKEFVGAPALRAQRDIGGYDRLVAFRMLDRAIPRQGMAIAGGGEVTSGTMSPSLGAGIGMGYVPEVSSPAGSELVIDVRGRQARAAVADRPLYRKGAA